MVTLERTFYLPSGRIFVWKTPDGHYIESTEMRDVTVDGKNHAEVRQTLDPKIIWKHLAPVKDKWLCTVSTQIGCTYSCKFCDVAQIKCVRNLTKKEILTQVQAMVNATPEVYLHGTKKAKIGFARMGEPMQNLDAVLGVMQKLNSSIKSPGHIDWLPCFNTIVPSKVNTLYGLEALAKVLDVKDDLGGMMHVQISVNSTDEATRKNLFNGANVVPLKSIIEFINTRKITNRTVTLNFISMKGVEVDLKKLQQYGLDPKKFAVKIIPLNATINATKNVLETEYNYKNVEQLKSLEHQFREAGIPVVTDAVAKCEEAALCCGQLVREYWPCSQ